MEEDKKVMGLLPASFYENSGVTTLFPSTLSLSVLGEKKRKKKRIKEFNLAGKIFRITASPDHRIVTGVEGENVHRLSSIHLSKLLQVVGGEKMLQTATRWLCAVLGNILLQHPVVATTGNRVEMPNFVFALGGAKLMASVVASSLSGCWNVGKQEETIIPWVALRKVTNAHGQLMEFRLNDEDQHYGPLLRKNRGNIFAIVFDDAALTTRSLVLAKEFSDQLGINIIGALVLFNQHGLKWPHVNIPVKVALANLPFQQYNDSDCPVCNSKKRRKRG